MIKIIYLILCFILGILLYQILKYICECNNIEGYGLFGRANLEKCCPIDYMYSDTEKKCVKICDGCGILAYGKLKHEFFTKNKTNEFNTYAECIGDASQSYDYDKINRRYEKSELKDQYDFGFGGQDILSDSVSGSGVQAAEEGENESWAGINTEISAFDSTTDFEGERESSPFGTDGFKGISTSLYYTDTNECLSDQTRYEQIRRNQENKKPTIDINYCVGDIHGNIKGAWKLNLENNNYAYINDDPDKYFPPPFIITAQPPEGITSASYIYSNKNLLDTLMKKMDTNTWVGQYYNDFNNIYQKAAVESETSLIDILKANRIEFCTGLKVARKLKVITDDVEKTLFKKICPLDGISNNEEWNNTCNSINDDNNDNYETILCKYNTEEKICNENIC